MWHNAILRHRRGKILFVTNTKPGTALTVTGLLPHRSMLEINMARQKNTPSPCRKQTIEQAHTIFSSMCVEVYQDSFNASLRGVRFC